MRLNKFISETGVCSRRQADQWIEAGRVRVNGVIATLGTQVLDGDAPTPILPRQQAPAAEEQDLSRRSA